MDNELVYFRFRAVEDPFVPQADVTIPRKHLQATPESLLSKRAAWNAEHADSNADDGTSASRAIHVNPSNDPYKKDWCHAMVELISDAYTYLYNKKENERPASQQLRGVGQPRAVRGYRKRTPPLKLPAGMELNVALVVLDYYGLTIDDPRSDISLENSNELIQIRALLFLKQMEVLAQIKNFIMVKLKTSPHRKSYFVHAHADDSMKAISDSQSERNTKSAFFRLGDQTNFVNIKEVLEEEPMRVWLVAMLGDVGLQADFIDDHLGLEDIPEHLRGQVTQVSSNGKCWLGTRFTDPESEDASYDIKYEMHERHVLRVYIPGP